MNTRPAGEHRHVRTICLCVDDFGLHAGINEAALRLAAMGRAQAVGCLVGGEAWRGEWIAELRRLPADRIDIGLHLDFTEVPLLPGSRRTLKSLLAASLLGHLDTAALRAEIRAQLDAFEAALGQGPAFVDGHRHVHQLAGVREELLDELVRRYGTRLPWVRSTRSARGPRKRLKPRGIEWLGASALAARCRHKGLAQNWHLLGVYDFRGGPERYGVLLEGWIADAYEADLLMCHPAIGAQADDPLIAARRAEYAVLSGPAFGAMLDQAGIGLAAMSEILAPTRARA